MSGPRAMVTGGAGFIGLHLCRRLLADGFEVFVIDNLSRHGSDGDLAAALPDLRFFDHDLTAGMPTVPGAFDAVFHLAAWVGVDRVEQNPHNVLRDNIAATAAVLDWCADHDVGSLFLSSTSEVGDGAAELGLAEVPVAEDAAFALSRPHSARSTYALSKLASEVLALHHCAARVRIGRYFNVYGPRMGYNHVIPQFIDRCLRGVDPFPVYGGENRRAFCFVADAVEATMRLVRLERADPLIVNIGDDTTELTMTELAELVHHTAGITPAMQIHPAAPGSPLRRVPDLRRLRELVGRLPRTTLVDGLRETLAWYANRAAG